VPKIVESVTRRYQPIAEALADLVNKVATLLPKRRARKLHVGLYGYSRGIGRVILPRAIPFTAALYSLGLPPEIFGASALSHLGEKDWKTLEDVYKNILFDLKFAASYFSWDTFEVLSKKLIKRTLAKSLKHDLEFLSENLCVKVGPTNYEQKKHSLLSTLFVYALINENLSEAKLYLMEMAKTRRFLG